ncbi:hypothetical protein [Glutamicibacter sp. PS]|uniref:hypothetical protein n=1 Tax=Glutamicibacter TaxID=1742989 RepID=UPI0028519A96|nr:hypothetical protein [Glutamicibacter sp. PS]MDR4533672.1 hypothetical protein [Glutamicibacter sp. PS]
MNALYLTMSATGTPVQNETLQNNSYGPGFIGFVATALMVIAAIFLIRDMIRRVRRVRYSSAAETQQADLVARGEAQRLQEPEEPEDPMTREDK